jgi:macrophage erythroblast attacher
MTSENETNGDFSQTVRKFESSFIRVPFEQFRRSFRMEMKVAEKDLPSLEGLIKKHLNGSGEVGENVMKALKERVKGLEDKLKEYRGESIKFRERFLKRMKWVEEMASSGNYRTWSRGRLIRLIGDFLIRTGDLEIVKEIGKRKPELIEEFDLELEEMREGIIKSLERKELTLALQWCADHRSNLKRITSDLEFKLRRQEFIELLKGGDVLGGIKLSQKYFPMWLEGNYREIREALALICWLPFLKKGIEWNNGLVKKYEQLLGDEEWEMIKEQFKREFMTIYQVDQSSQLMKTVRTGLAVLKTRQCTGKDDGIGSECPACTGPLKELSTQLPHGHFETTKIRCRITGKLVSEDDPPMALPNGQVYSESGLKLLCDGSGGSSMGVLKCPVTGGSFMISEARKCYFL